MHILLVNTNPIVSRLIALNTRDDTAIHVDEINGTEMIPGEWYDVVFLDEKCCDAETMGAYLQKVRAGRKILFSSRKENGVEGIDRVIMKPFLPSEITAVLQSILQNKEMAAEEGHLPPRESGEAAEDSGKEEILILDGQEIELIKQLLLDEEQETTESEESEVEPESVIVKEQEKPKKRKKPKKKEKKKTTSKAKNKSLKFEEKLLEALVEMKPQKIRKLLEGAEVSIAIRFPKGA